MTQVVIVGAGIIGATIAYELSQIQGLDITLIEEKTPASGATCAALGILIGILSHKLKGRLWRLRNTSIKRYQTLLPELENLTGISIPHNRQGIVSLRFDEEDLSQWEKLVNLRHTQGWCLELWDKAQLTRKCPQIQNERVVGAVYSPDDLQINPTILTEALVAGAAKNGVNCLFGVKVQNVGFSALDDSNIRHCSHVYTRDGILTTDWLIVAAGLGSTPLTTSLQETLDIRPVLGQALRLKLDHPLESADFAPVISGEDVHIAPLGGGEYGIGATVEFPEDTGELSAKPALLANLRQQAIAFCPALARGQIVETWSGKRPRPEGQPAPVICKLAGYDNVLLATGHYRNGILLAPATALEIRDLLVNSTLKIIERNNHQ